MKILQVAPYYRPYPGGQECYVANLSKYLLRKGHEVHIMTSNYPNGKRVEELDGLTIERHDVVIRLLRNPIAFGFFNIKHSFKNYDIVHIHNEHSFPAMVTALCKFKNDFPLILTNHGKLVFGNFVLDLFEKMYITSLGRIIFKKADKIVVLSNSQARYVSSFGLAMEKITILPNAIDQEYFEPYLLKDNSKFLQKYDIAGKQIILYVGQIIQRKGIEYLLKSIRLIKKIQPEKNFVCLIVGKGEYTKKLKEMVKIFNIEKYVIFTGELPLDELVFAYESANVYVLPSLSEGMPTTILEAMYFGLPVVSTNIPGVREYFNKNALLVPPKDERKLANALLTILDNQDIAKSLSKDGKKFVEIKYTWDVVASQYCEVYKNMILDIE